jgi:hypothetical protein
MWMLFMVKNNLESRTLSPGNKNGIYRYFFSDALNTILITCEKESSKISVVDVDSGHDPKTI